MRVPALTKGSQSDVENELAVVSGRSLTSWDAAAGMFTFNTTALAQLENAVAEKGIHAIMRRRRSHDNMPATYAELRAGA